MRPDLARRFAAGLRGDRDQLAEIERQRAAELAALDAELERVRAARAFWRAVAHGGQHPTRSDT